MIRCQEVSFFSPTGTSSTVPTFLIKGTYVVLLLYSNSSTTLPTYQYTRTYDVRSSVVPVPLLRSTVLLCCLLIHGHGQGH